MYLAWQTASVVTCWVFYEHSLLYIYPSLCKRLCWHDDVIFEEVHGLPKLICGATLVDLTKFDWGLLDACIAAWS